MRTPEDSLNLVRRAFCAYNDVFAGADESAFLDLVDPEVEWHTFIATQEPVYRGREGVRRWMLEFFDSWAELHVEPETVLHATEEIVVVPLRIRGKGKASRLPVEMVIYEFVRIRDGRILERRPYQHRDAALAEAQASVR